MLSPHQKSAYISPPHRLAQVGGGNLVPPHQKFQKENPALAILSASSGGKYEPEEILGKVKYTICDSTAHNLKVIDKVCQDLDVSDVPPTLLCNVHPLMMMQLKIKELCQSIHDNIGNQKISECFLVDVEFKSQSFVLKSY